MKTKIIIASHGNFAEGILNSLQMISGVHENVEALCAYQDHAIDYPSLIAEKVKNHDYTKQHLLVITDLLGGSVNNEFMQHRISYPFYLVAGLNLSLLLELVLNSDNLDEDKISHIVTQNKNYIVFCDDNVLTEQEESDF